MSRQKPTDYTVYRVPKPKTVGLRIIGHLPSGASMLGKPPKPSSFVRDALIHLGDHDPYDRFAVMYPTPIRYINTFLKYDLVRGSFTDHHTTGFQYARYCLRRRYFAICNGWIVRNFDSISVPWNSGPGWPYSLDVHLKKEALQHYGWLADVMFDAAGQKGYNPYIVWSVFVKTELLKAKKIINDDARSIISPPFDLVIVQKRMVSDFNERIAGSWRTTPVQLGFTKYFGEFHRLAVELSTHPHKREEDALKWDAHSDPNYAHEINEFRKETISPAHKSPENMNRLDFILKEDLKTRMLSPTNVVVQKKDGTPSGSSNTSTINSLSNNMQHDETWAVIVSIPLSEEGDLDYSFDAWYEHELANNIFKCAGDDSAESYSRSVAHLYTPDRTIEYRSRIRMEYPREKFIDTEDLSKLTFLGSKFTFDTHYQKWVPRFDGDKAIHSALYPDQNTGIHVDLYRVLALRCEAYWDIHARMKLAEVRDYLQSLGAVPKPTKKISLPRRAISLLLQKSDKALVDLYFGQESSSSKELLTWLGLPCVVGEETNQSSIPGDVTTN